MKKLLIGFVGMMFIFACGKVGPQGVSGSVGANGVPGAQGSPGVNGSNGNNGSDASVQFVQLCQGTTHYPDTFCEVAQCVDGVLYGVYSANGGFGSALPNGAYNSNGINCSCTVTIGDNCQVSN